MEHNGLQLNLVLPSVDLKLRMSARIYKSKSVAKWPWMASFWKLAFFVTTPLIWKA